MSVFGGNFFFNTLKWTKTISSVQAPASFSLFRLENRCMFFHKVPLILLALPLHQLMLPNHFEICSSRFFIMFFRLHSWIYNLEKIIICLLHNLLEPHFLLFFCFLIFLSLFLSHDVNMATLWKRKKELLRILAWKYYGRLLEGDQKRCLPPSCAVFGFFLPTFSALIIGISTHPPSVLSYLLFFSCTLTEQRYSSIW